LHKSREKQGGGKTPERKDTQRKTLLNTVTAGNVGKKPAKRKTEREKRGVLLTVRNVPERETERKKKGDKLLERIPWTRGK